MCRPKDKMIIEIYIRVQNDKKVGVIYFTSRCSRFQVCLDLFLASLFKIVGTRIMRQI